MIDIIDAAIEGSVEAELILGVLFEQGYFGENPEKTFEWFKRAADHGSHLAQYIVSEKLKDGKGVAKNNDEAFKYLLKAVDGNVSPAVIRLAQFYEEGIGVNKSVEDKLSILKKAANSGNVRAALHLGFHFSDTKNTELDYKEALKWFLLAESLGSASAFFHMAGIYKDMHDFANALFYYKKACDSGNENACLFMAINYSKGKLGLEQNDGKAKYYNNRAKEIQLKRKHTNEMLFSLR